MDSFHSAVSIATLILLVCLVWYVFFLGVRIKEMRWTLKALHLATFINLYFNEVRGKGKCPCCGGVLKNPDKLDSVIHAEDCEGRRLVLEARKFNNFQ